jgi:23S rRNA pseudouridine2605 synthase
VRLNKFLARCGVASRRSADELIASGRVRIDGRIVRELGTMVEENDRVEVDGAPVIPAPSFSYYVLNKPAGVVTTMFDPQGRPSVANFVPAGRRVVPVGRLDFDTSGVLLLTDDGDLAHRLTHPRFGVDKTYRAVVRGELSPDDVERLTGGGISIDGRASAPAAVRVVARRRGETVVDITLHEGRNRQVRRMFDALGHPVDSLVRMRFGPIALGDLRPGTTRALFPAEARALERRRLDGPSTTRSESGADAPGRSPLSPPRRHRQANRRQTS